jgi:ABC-2 type transport system ATP-binding protein
MIKAEHLTKTFNSFKAVNDISFSVNKGEIFAFLGPNGAGKTTTIRMLTGILELTSGTAYIGDYDIKKNPLEAKQRMGIVPEMANAYLDLSAMRNLLLIGELYGIEKGKGVEKAERLLKLLDLYEKRNQKVKTFSKGMQQRVILAMAMMNNAEILFLDEPTSGLDVESARLIRQIIRDFNQKGMTIFLTTHNIEEANSLCDRVAIINYGKIVAIDRPEKLKQTIQSTSSIEVALKNKIEPTEIRLEGISKVKKVGDKLRLYTNDPGATLPILIEYFQDSGNEIVSLNTLGPSLEDVFVELTKNKK